MAEDKTLRQKVSEQGLKIDSIDKKMDSVITAIKGDDMGHEGLLHKVNKNKNDLEETNKRLNEHLAEVEKDKEVQKRLKRWGYVVWTAIVAVATFVGKVIHF